MQIARVQDLSSSMVMPLSAVAVKRNKEVTLLLRMDGSFIR
jgi:hypothetical protein